MSNRNKARGTAFETATIKYLRERGFRNVYRPATKGKYDTGDVNGIDNGTDDGRPVSRQVIIQNKNAKTFKLSEWLKGAEEQASQDEVRPSKYNSDVGEWEVGASAIPAVVFKRPGVGYTRMGDQYVLMSFNEFVTLLKEAGYS